jgi:hypothetical protein
MTVELYMKKYTCACLEEAKALRSSPDTGCRTGIPAAPPSGRSPTHQTAERRAARPRTGDGGLDVCYPRGHPGLRRPEAVGQRVGPRSGLRFEGKS